MKIETAEAPPALSPIYLDSALIAKFYLNEPGREIVRGLTKKAGVVVASGIAAAEVSAAFHRKFREGNIDREIFDALNGQFEHDLAAGLWRLIGPTPALLDEVRSLFSKLDKSIFLRSLDALHLITAKAERFDRIYSNDKRLLDGCPSVGIDGVNPIPHTGAEVASAGPSGRTSNPIKPGPRKSHKK